MDSCLSLQPSARRDRISGSSYPHSSFNKWITCPYPNPTARLRLFCLPFAGGGASVFRTWGKALPPTVEVCPVQLPGRENRVTEPPYTDVWTLAERLACQLRPYVQKPFAVFGHSMGALLAFELTRTLRCQNGPLPRVLFLSAHRAAHLPLRGPPLSQLPDAEFIRKMRGLGGTPEEVFENQELLNFTLPALRADFTLHDSYRCIAEPPLDCPLVLYAGHKDTEVSPQEVEAWRKHTTQTARLRLFPGDHFFLRSDRDLLLRAITTTLGQFEEHNGLMRAVQ